MNEIRFRASEDQLLEELERRREVRKWFYTDLPCDTCGSRSYVIADLSTRTCECEQCWANRRYLELIDGVEQKETKNDYR